MAMNELINRVVDVQIRNITTNTYSRNLNTILVLAKGDEFTEPYRVYGDSTSMVEDGFDYNGYAYNAVRTIFSQEIVPTEVVVALVSPTATEEDYLDKFNEMLNVTQGWLWLISDLRNTNSQVELAKLVEVNDKMYCAATHEDGAFDSQSTTDLASRIKALSLRNTFVWYDEALEDYTPDLNGEWEG